MAKLARCNRCNCIEATDNGHLPKGWSYMNLLLELVPHWYFFCKECTNRLNFFVNNQVTYPTSH